MPRTDLPTLRRAFDQALGEKDWNVADLQRATAVGGRKALDIDTVRDAVKGVRWPSQRSRARLERALGWGPGWMQDIRDDIYTLDELRAIRDSRRPAVQLRDPRTHTLAEATDAELQAEVDRRRGVTKRAVDV